VAHVNGAGPDADISGMALAPGWLSLSLGSRSHPPSDAAISSMGDGLGTGSHPPSEAVKGSDAARSSMAKRLRTGAHPPSDGVKGSDVAISRLADQPGPGSNCVVRGFEAAISGMAARLGLAANVGERAKDVYRKIDKARAWPRGKGWKKDRIKSPLAYAACLAIACRAAGSVLSLRELSQAVAVDGGTAATMDIARLIKHINKQLEEELAGQSTGVGMASVSDYVHRFGALVGLRQADSAAALEAARRLDKGIIDVRHNVDIVAAGVVRMALQRAGAKRPVKKVCAATGVPYFSIFLVCKTLRTHAQLLFG
jgi:transcription initiation factor TFIIB